MTKAQIIDEVLLLRNPFIGDFEIPVTKVISSKEKHVREGIWVDKSYEIEQIPSVHFHLHKHAQSIIAGLSDKAMRLLFHIVCTIKPNQDYLILDPAYFMKENRINSYTTYMKCVKELERYRFIKSELLYKHLFWINPENFFPGTRKNKYPERVVIKKTWEQKFEMETPSKNGKEKHTKGK